MIAGILSRVGILLAVNLPIRSAHRVAAAAGRHLHRTTARQTMAMLRSTVTSRLGIGSTEAEPLVRKILERGAVEQLEGGVFRFKSKRRIGALVDIRGVETLDAALERGRGCILYSGHFRGRWSFFAALGLLGYRPLLVRQNAPAGMSRSAAWFQRQFDRMFATKFGCAFLFMEGTPFSATAAAAHLRRNGVLITMIDISSYTNRVVEVDFLMRKEPFPIGAVLLAQLTGAPLLGFTIRYAPDERRYVCEFGAAEHPSKDQLESTQRLAAVIEAGIRSHPEDWAGWQKSQYLGR